MRTDKGLDRLTTFLDAVVAIAITLLVLPLVDLLPGAARDTDLAAVLVGNAGQFGAFLLSFAVISRLWWAHHRLGEKVGAYDGAFVLINLVWILTIVVLPFVTRVVVVYGTGRLTVALYLGTIAASSACLSLLNLLIWRRPALRREGVEAGQAAPWAALATFALLVLAIVLGMAVRAVNYYALLLLFLSGPVERQIRRRAERVPG